MTITVEIGPEFEAEFARQAAARGVGIDTYAANLLEEAAKPKSSPPAKEVVEAIERLRESTRTPKYWSTPASW